MNVREIWCLLESTDICWGVLVCMLEKLGVYWRILVYVGELVYIGEGLLLVGLVSSGECW